MSQRNLLLQFTRFAVSLVVLSIPVACGECGTSSRVQKGDTCIQISRRFGLTEAELVELNPGLDCGAISPGTTVCVADAPQKRSLSEVTNSVAIMGGYPDELRLAGAVEPPAPLNCEKYILPVKGDTCESIAQKQGITVENLVSINKGVELEPPLNCSSKKHNLFLCVSAKNSVPPSSPEGNTTPSPPSTKASAPPSPPSTKASAPPSPPSTKASAPPSPPSTKASAPPSPPSTKASAPPSPPSTKASAPPSPKASATPSGNGTGDTPAPATAPVGDTAPPVPAVPSPPSACTTRVTVTNTSTTCNDVYTMYGLSIQQFLDINQGIKCEKPLNVNASVCINSTALLTSSPPIPPSQLVKGSSVPRSVPHILSQLLLTFISIALIVSFLS